MAVQKLDAVHCLRIECGVYFSGILIVSSADCGRRGFVSWRYGNKLDLLAIVFAAGGGDVNGFVDGIVRGRIIFR